MATAIDARGGSVGKIGDYERNHAICLAGGSLYGLMAMSGVGEELFRRPAGHIRPHGIGPARVRRCAPATAAQPSGCRPDH